MSDKRLEKDWILDRDYENKKYCHLVIENPERASTPPGEIRSMLCHLQEIERLLIQQPDFLCVIFVLGNGSSI